MVASYLITMYVLEKIFYEGHYYGREERPNTELALYVEPYFHMNLDFHGKVNGEKQAK